MRPRACAQARANNALKRTNWIGRLVCTNWSGALCAVRSQRRLVSSSYRRQRKRQQVSEKKRAPETGAFERCAAHVCVTSASLVAAAAWPLPLGTAERIVSNR